MRCMVVIILLTCVLAINGEPYGLGGYGSRGGRYGDEGYGAGSAGYHQHGHGQSGASAGHDIGHESHDYKQITEAHSSRGHNVGGSNQFSSGGYGSGGHQDHVHGHGTYGDEYNRGYLPFKDKH